MTLDLFSEIAKPLHCPDCNIDMHFLASRPTKRVFVATILERVFFLCPNCQCLSHRLVTMPAPSSGMTVNPGGIFGGRQYQSLDCSPGRAWRAPRRQAASRRSPKARPCALRKPNRGHRSVGSSQSLCANILTTKSPIPLGHMTARCAELASLRPTPFRSSGDRGF
jgi:hypothetical protein